jgi:hypothetical protein
MIPEKKYFLFPKPHRNHLLFLFYFISSIIKQYIFKGIKEEDNLSIPIFKLYIYEIGDLFSIIPYLILKKKTKTKNIAKPNDDDTTGNDYYIYNDIKIEQYNKKKKPIMINLFIISLVNFIALISTIIFYLTEKNQKMTVKHPNLNILLVFNIIFLFLLTKFMLNIELYLHHYFSLIIFIACLVVITVIDFIAINENIVEEYKDSLIKESHFINSSLYIIIRIFVVLLYSIENILAKIMFLKYYYSPYLLQLMKAIIKLFFIFIFSLPLIFIKINGIIIFSLFKDIFKKYILENIFRYIIYLINHFFYNILNYLIIDKFSPAHTVIAYIFEYFAIFLINTTTTKTGEKIIVDYKFGVRLVMYILLIIASLIFNEFVVINVCGLANNTKLFLDYKEKNDLNLIGELNNKITPDDLISEDNIEENNRNSVIGKKENNIELTEL